MRLRQRQGRGGPTENLIPLINIVFLILIFFLVASTLRSFDPGGLDLTQARAEAGAEQGPNVLLVFADGGLKMAGETIAEDALADRLSAFKRTNPELPLLIAPDQALAAGRLVAIAATARAAGVENVLLVVRKRSSASGAGQ
ncbi:MAG: ExbD/TolR family protein [Dichotomicrobium sp.]